MKNQANEVGDHMDGNMHYVPLFPVGDVRSCFLKYVRAREIKMQQTQIIITLN